MPARPTGGSDLLTNLTPASETLTGETWDDDPVYRTHYSTASATNGATIVNANCKAIVRACVGYEDYNNSNLYPLPFQAISSSSEALCYIDTGASNVIKLLASNNCASRPMKITVDYTKN